MLSLFSHDLQLVRRCLQGDTLADTAPNSDPLDYVTRQPVQHLIEQAIGELPPLYREVFVLLRVEGLKQSETAHILQLPIGTVQSRLGRGVRLLRQRLRELEVMEREAVSELPAQAGAKLEEETHDAMQALFTQTGRWYKRGLEIARPNQKAILQSNLKIIQNTWR